MRDSYLARVLTGLVTLLLCACAPNYAYRTHLVSGKAVNCPLPTANAQDDARPSTDCMRVTPEVTQGAYELHFVEFDDQGWLYPDKPASGAEPAASPSGQIDHLMKRLTQLLDQHDDGKPNDLSIIVYVHGWKHNAQSDDANVRHFRTMLRAAAAEERDRAGRDGTPRKVVGVYVAWRGKSWVVPDPVLSLSFWARKEAARRVSVGTARELFARLRAIRHYYNNEAASAVVTTGAASEQAVRRPRIRTLMIGHSFGGLILYAATSGPIIEALAAQQDLRGVKPAQDLAERPADMIVLINPAFEASRYEALYRVANRFQPVRFQPPLFVSVTSTKDWATGIAFPLGRSVNALFEHEASSEEGTAIKNTPGHIARYLTHRLYGHAPNGAPEASAAVQDGKTRCQNWKSEEQLQTLPAADLGEAVRLNKKIEAENSAEFFSQNLTPEHLLKPKWGRTFCGGSYLTPVEGNGVDNANTLVWNIETDGEVIRNHDDVMNPIFRAFMRQLYADVSMHP
ncbi:hypothetical protein [Cupriavidus oxalaticus]|uniref:hypothetical protein n=1 Tax=Cupriavidus oxalaticus TaxID=96344 RepID=UPI00317D4F6E